MMAGTFIRRVSIFQILSPFVMSSQPRASQRVEPLDARWWQPAPGTLSAPVTLFVAGSILTISPRAGTPTHKESPARPRKLGHHDQQVWRGLVKTSESTYFTSDSCHISSVSVIPHT